MCYRSTVPPVRDEESETQRRAHAKRVRETRRSTQVCHTYVNVLWIVFNCQVPFWLDPKGADFKSTVKPILVFHLWFYSSLKCFIFILGYHSWGLKICWTAIFTKTTRRGWEERARTWEREWKGAGVERWFWQEDILATKVCNLLAGNCKCNLVLIFCLKEH